VARVLGVEAPHGLEKAGDSRMPAAVAAGPEEAKEVFHGDLTGKCGIYSGDHGRDSRAQIALCDVATSENTGDSAAIGHHFMERVPSVSTA